jgi:capsular exopolysaccharide synthesis family protein
MLITTPTLLGTNPVTSAYLESFRVLRSSFLALHDREPFRTALITSITEGDGKTTISVNLAIVLAMADKSTILVDVDFLGEGTSKVLGVGGRPGFTDLCLGTATLEQVITPTELPKLKIVATGTAVERGPELVASSGTEQTIRALADQCDFLIFDALPLSGFSAALSLCRLVERTFVVVLARSRVNAVRQGLNTLTSAGGNIGGLIVNDVMPRDSIVYQSHKSYYGGRR